MGYFLCRAETDRQELCFVKIEVLFFCVRGKRSDRLGDSMTGFGVFLILLWAKGLGVVDTF